jgi:hypothetical protein
MGVATYTKNERGEIEEVTLQSGVKVKPVYGPEDLADLKYETGPRTLRTSNMKGISATPVNIHSPGVFTPVCTGHVPGPCANIPALAPPMRPISGSNCSSLMVRRG